MNRDQSYLMHTEGGTLQILMHCFIFEFEFLIRIGTLKNLDSSLTDIFCVTKSYCLEIIYNRYTEEKINIFGHKCEAGNCHDKAHMKCSRHTCYEVHAGNEVHVSLLGKKYNIRRNRLKHPVLLAAYSLEVMSKSTELFETDPDRYHLTIK